MSDKKKYLVIYHASCLDGFGAAYAAWKKFGNDAEYIAAQYGDVPPDCKGRDVFILDFSYRRAVIEQLCDEAAFITLIDHHKTAIEDLEGFGHSYGHFILNDEHSGAALAWDYFHEGKTPRIIKYIEDRDLWKFEMGLTKEITAYLHSFDLTFELFDEIAKKMDDDLEAFEQMVAEGEAILRMNKKHIAILTNPDKTVKASFEGHHIEMVNCPGWLASDVGNILAKRNNFGLSYFDIPGKRVFSLRSDELGIDVSEIAKNHGGGGHKHAAGFSITIFSGAIQGVPFQI